MVITIYTRIANFSLTRLWVFFVSSLFTLTASAMPEELYEGMIQFELNSGKYFDALVLMDENYKKSHPIDFATSLKGFNIIENVDSIIANSRKQKELIANQDYFNIGKIEYQSGDCIPALKSFKKLKNKLSLEEKQQWAFYRANCFIKLGSNKRSAQALAEMLSGVWASYAYYNLALSYAEGSRDKRKAIGVLNIARSLNEGKTREEKSLNDRINLAIGSLYLEGGKPDLAIKFFNKIYLESLSTADALYLNGVAYHESGDFRAATQAWVSAKKYPLVSQSVAESLLAIPFAYERSGYISQALEAYLEASTSFESELEKINKIDTLLGKYGVQKVLIEESEIDGLEWFLSKDVVTNTARAAYYSYFMQDVDIYDAIELHSELMMLRDSLDFWMSQLKVFELALNQKRKNYKTKSKKFDASVIENKISTHNAAILSIKNNNKLTPTLEKNLQIQEMANSIDTLISRLNLLEGKINKGRDTLKEQLRKSSSLHEKISNSKKQLNNLISSLDTNTTALVRTKLSELHRRMTANFEKAQQGLVHIFEGIAESKQIKKRNLLDGRYK